jgi:hypothetical protein
MSIDTEVERRCLANRLLVVVGRSLAIVIAKARSLIEERGLTASVSVLIEDCDDLRLAEFRLPHDRS